jgi:hypothetical protein
VTDDEEPRRRLAELERAVDRALRDTDPINLITIGAPADEYAPELRTIPPRFRDAATQVDVQRIVHEEFRRWFGPNTAGPMDRYAELSRRIWEALEEFRRDAASRRSVG